MLRVGMEKHKTADEEKYLDAAFPRYRHHIRDVDR